MRNGTLIFQFVMLMMRSTLCSVLISINFIVLLIILMRLDLLSFLYRIITHIIVLWSSKQTFYLIVMLLISKDFLHYFTLISVRNNWFLRRLFLYIHISCLFSFVIVFIISVVGGLIESIESSLQAFINWCK